MPYLGNEVAPLVQALEGKELKLDSDGDSSITADTDDQIDFKTGGTDRLQIQSTAGNNVVIADGLTLTDGNLVVANGHGIDFSATSDASGMASELLDDYEEGSHNPTSGSGVSMSASLGSYSKVGNVCVFYFRIVFGSESSSSDAYITLPFTSKSESVNAHFASGVPFYTTYTASAVHFGIIQNNTKLEFYNGTINSISFADVSGKQFNGSIVYLTA